MTNTEARKITFDECKIKCVAYEEDCENMSIGECRKRLEALEQKPCEDAISREKLIKDLNFLYNKDGFIKDTRAKRTIETIMEQSLVTPQPKTGHWIYDYVSADGHRVYHCSECGCYLKPKHSEPLSSYKWCSLCGAKMVEPQESEDKECK